MYERILVPVDGSPTALRGLQEAIALAARLGSSIHVVHAVEVTLPATDIVATRPLDELIEPLKAAGEKLVAAAVAKAREAGCTVEGSVRCELGHGVSDIVLREAADRQASLIVMGTHGRRGMLRLALGSDAEMVLRGSPVPVLLVRNPGVPADR
ncbi:universal stress protein [Aquincola sp. S2]|uniref:Universal stress protein n=1 Tax=Pseudaquabacterium terrae TaxID=2732868 RepID=A0ABX2ER93_9BURK|nr:universal stress protein [Aquabacterium terrae]NRF71128.1 universal stress protein [Aquabacterium terrae]